MKPGNMTVVNFDPPLERKDFESVLKKVQDMFPDWEWCANTGTPTVRDREKILPGIMKNQNISGYGAPIYTEKIGSLIHYGRFKHYGEADCLGYTSNWSQADTNHYIKQGYDVEVIDGWAIDKHNITLDTDSMFKDLNESVVKKVIKKILKEEIDWFESEDFESSPAEKFLYDKFMECKLGLVHIRNKSWFGWTRYVDKNGKILFLDNIETGKKDTILYFDYDEIYKNLEEMGLNYEEMKVLVKDMLYETHKRKVLTAFKTQIELLVWLH